MRLVVVELRRYFGRRAVVILLFVAALGTFGTAAGMLVNHDPVSENDRQRSIVLAEQQNSDPFTVKELDRCVERSGNRAQCEREWLVKPSEMLYEPQLNLRSFKEWLLPMTAIVAALLMLVGATFVGADFASGSLSNQLLFRPVRWQVWAAKVVALGVAGCVVGIVTIGAANAIIYGFARAWDRPLPAQAVEHLVVATGRSIALCALFGLVGFAIALVTRHTAAALGLIAFYGLAVETVTRLLWPNSEKWLLSNHVFAFVGGDWKLENYNLCSDTDFSSANGCAPTIFSFTGEFAAGYLIGLAAIVVLASLLVFRTRDVA